MLLNQITSKRFTLFIITSNTYLVNIRYFNCKILIIIVKYAIFRLHLLLLSKCYKIEHYNFKHDILQYNIL